MSERIITLVSTGSDGAILRERVAREMAQVGATIMLDDAPVGHVFKLLGQPAVITGEISYQEFLERVDRAGLNSAKFADLETKGFRFYAFSTD